MIHLTQYGGILFVLIGAEAVSFVFDVGHFVKIKGQDYSYWNFLLRLCSIILAIEYLDWEA